jgi:DNA uptake protein ComE-like DNA-binding protein
MPILISADGQRVQVHNMQLQSFLDIGYRYDVEKEFVPESTNALSDVIKINTASLKELTDKLKLTTLQAKDIREKRPYSSISDLINQFPDIPWHDFNLNYEV